jgi:predicted  nucleic acid-binding Zn-ribbon protein
MEPRPDKPLSKSIPSQPKPSQSNAIPISERSDSLSQASASSASSTALRDSEKSSQNPNLKLSDSSTTLSSEPKQTQSQGNKLADYLQPETSQGAQQILKSEESPKGDAESSRLVYEIGTAVPPNTPEFDEIQRGKTKSFINQSPMPVIHEEERKEREEEDKKAQIAAGSIRAEKSWDLPAQITIKSRTSTMKTQQETGKTSSEVLSKDDLPQQLSEATRSKTPPPVPSQSLPLESQSQPIPAATSSEPTSKPTLPTTEQGKSPISKASSAPSYLSTQSSLTGETKPSDSIPPPDSEISRFELPSQTITDPGLSQESKQSEPSRYRSISEGRTLISDEDPAYLESDQGDLRVDAQLANRERMITPEPRTARSATTKRPGSEDRHEVSFSANQSPLTYTPRSGRKFDSREIADSMKKTENARKILGASTPVLNAIDKQIQKKESHEDSGVVPIKPLVSSSVTEKKPFTSNTKVIIKQKEEIKTESSAVTVFRTYCTSPLSNKLDTSAKDESSDIPNLLLTGILRDFASKSPQISRKPSYPEESPILNSSFNIPPGNSAQNTPHRILQNLQESPELPRKLDCSQCHEHKEKVEQLRKEIDQKSTEESKAVQNFNSQMENLRMEISQFQQKEDEFKAKNIDLELRVHRLEEEAAAAEEEIGRLRHENSILNMDTYSLKSEVKQVNEIRDSAKKQSDKLEEMVKDLNILAEENANLKKDVEDKRKAIDGYEKRNKELSDENEIIKAELKINEARVNDLEIEKQILQSKIQGLCEEHEAVKKLLRDSEEMFKALEILKSDLEKDKKYLDSKLKDIENTVIQYKVDIKSLTDKHNQLDQHKQQLSQELEAGNQKISHLESHTASLESTRNSQAGEIENLKGIVKDKEDAIYTAESCIKTHEATIKDQISQLDSYKAEVEQYKQTVKSLENHKNILISEKTNITNHLDLLQSDLKSAEEKIKELECTREKLEANVAELENSLKIKHEESNKQEATIAKNKRDIDKANKLIKVQQEENRAQRQSFEEEIKHLSNEQKELEGSYLNKLNKAERNNKEIVHQLQHKLKNSQSDLMLSQKTVEGLNKVIETYKAASLVSEVRIEYDSMLKPRETIEASFMSERGQPMSREIYLALGVFMGIVISFTLMYFKPF